MKTLTFFFISALVLVKPNPTLNIKNVIRDFQNGNTNIPDYHIEEGNIKIFYINNCALAHLSYKENRDPYIQSSAIAVYHLKKQNWKLMKFIPYTPNISLLDSARAIFVSANRNCKMTGECYDFTVVSQFSNNEMRPIIDYSGFDHGVAYTERIIYNEEAIELLVGDTVKNTTRITNARVLANNIVFDLERSISVLRGKSEKTLQMDEQSWLINNVVTEIVGQ